MRTKIKATLISCACIIGALLGTAAVILWWPVPSCSENEFEESILVSSELLKVRMVDKQVMPLDSSALPPLERWRSVIHGTFSPPARLGLDFGRDPHLIRIGLEGSNAQMRAMGFVSADRVVRIGLHIFGDHRLAEATGRILKNWKPTEHVPVATRQSGKPFWGPGREEAEHPAGG